MPRWSKAVTKMELEELYRSLIPKLRATARRAGYALGVHGSLKRDLDLIAVPWVQGAVTPQVLAKRISLAACGLYTINRQQRWERKPHGRMAIALMIGRRAYIDLSVCKPTSRKT